MPKKISTNPKALEARARKEDKKRTEQEKTQKAKEDALWADDDKLIGRKVNRKDERERKRQEELEKKQLNKQLYEEEMNSIPTAKPQPPAKVTRSQIVEKTAMTSRSSSLKKSSSECSLEENPNLGPVEQVSASNIDEALAILRYLFLCSKIAQFALKRFFLFPLVFKRTPSSTSTRKSE